MGHFDHDRLGVYRLALEFDALVASLVPRRGCHIIRDQIDRSSLGVVLCIAEGSGRRSPKDKRRFYAMARGSATESAAVLDVLYARKFIRAEGYARGRTLLLSIVRMLTRLCGPPEPEPEPDPSSLPPSGEVAAES
jgi:four helix bundle protein